MTSPTVGHCLVCYAETKNRCSSCAKSGTNLFFCSPEHQKLAWQGHRLFCGPSAYPLVFPGLSDEELTAVFENLYKPQSLPNGGLFRPSDIFSLDGEMTPELLEGFIGEELTKTTPRHQESSPQYLLMRVRTIYPLESLSLPAQLLSQFSKAMNHFVGRGMISDAMLSHPCAHCELLHRVFTVITLTEHDRKLPTSKAFRTSSSQDQP
ncbi:hypothetical protein JCM10296v2_003393 [Rhodotorula toruloides]